MLRNNRHNTGKSERSWPPAEMRVYEGIRWGEGAAGLITQTRQGCFAVTEWYLNERADSRPWIRYRDGVAGTRAYIKRLND